MRKSLIDRVNACADYIIETNNTIRQTAKEFKISKSTVHKDIQERLKEINLEKYEKVKSIFDSHIKISHLRGGQYTKEKYLTQKLES